MRLYSLLITMIVVALFPAARGFAAPQRVMSLNLCADQMVLDLLPPERITSVSWLAREGYGSYLAAKASHVAINYGTAEEVLAQQPDLVVAGLYTATTTRMLLKRVGAPLIELPPAEDFDAIRANTRLIGRALGEEAKAEAEIREMDATLAELAATAPKRRIVIAGWDGSGAVPGPKTLFTAILNAAGAENIAVNHGGEGYAKFDLEQLLLAHPDLLAYGDSNTSKPSIRTEGRRHPALRHRYAGREFIYPELLYTCGLPQSAEAAKELRKAMTDMLAQPAGGP
jgi:iron complex transport system substrate-binding protein